MEEMAEEKTEKAVQMKKKSLVKKCHHVELDDFGDNLDRKTFRCRNRKCRKRMTFNEAFGEEKDLKVKIHLSTPC